MNLCVSYVPKTNNRRYTTIKSFLEVEEALLLEIILRTENNPKTVATTIVA